MNADIFKCSKCFTYSFNVQLEGLPLLLGTKETVKLTPISIATLPIFDFEAISPIELTGIQIQLGMASQSGTPGLIDLQRIYLDLELTGQKPDDNISVTSNLENPNKLYFFDFGTSEMSFTNSTKYRNVDSLSILNIVGYSPFDDYNNLSEPFLNAIVGVTINLYYI